MAAQELRRGERRVRQKILSTRRMTKRGPDRRAPAPDETAGDWIADVLRDVAELPDRDSPDDWPEAMLVTGDELRRIIERHKP